MRFNSNRFRVLPSPTSTSTSTSDIASGLSSSKPNNLPVAPRRWRRVRSAKDLTSINHSSSASSGPRNRLRRYIVLSSTVLLIAYSTLVAKVPFVNGRARAGQSGSGSIFASVDLFRLAQRPWGSLSRRKRIRQPAIDYSNNREEHLHNSPVVDNSSICRIAYNLTLNNIDFSDEHRSNLLSSKILYHHHYAKYHSKITTKPFIRPKQALSHGLQTTTKEAFFGSPKMVASAFTNDWVYIPRGGDVEEKSDVASVTTISPNVVQDPVSVIIDDTLSEKVTKEKISDPEKVDVVGTEGESLISTDDVHQPSGASLENEVSDTEERVVSHDSLAAEHASMYEFSFYQEGDGSDDDVDKIPIRYLKMHNDNRERAKQAMEETMKWRELNNIDSIIGIPHPDYDVCKATFPHFFLGYDNTKTTVVFIQRPALLNMELAKKNQLTNQALLNHYVYVNEYLWRIVEADRPLAKMTSIIDLYGLNLSILRQTEIIGFLKIFVQTMDSHFPQRASKTLLINAPKWFHMLYKLISPMLRETTKEKIKIYSNGDEQDSALLEVIHPDNINATPKTFWSSSKKDAKNVPGKSVVNEDDGEITAVSQLERELRVFTLARLQEAGVEIQEVVY